MAADHFCCCGLSSRQAHVSSGLGGCLVAGVHVRPELRTHPPCRRIRGRPPLPPGRRPMDEAWETASRVRESAANLLGPSHRDMLFLTDQRRGSPAGKRSRVPGKPSSFGSFSPPLRSELTMKRLVL